jgi:hypothetical protein
MKRTHFIRSAFFILLEQEKALSVSYADSSPKGRACARSAATSPYGGGVAAGDGEGKKGTAGLPFLTFYPIKT